MLTDADKVKANARDDVSTQRTKDAERVITHLLRFAGSTSLPVRAYEMGWE